MRVCTGEAWPYEAMGVRPKTRTPSWKTSARRGTTKGDGVRNETVRFGGVMWAALLCCGRGAWLTA